MAKLIHIGFGNVVNEERIVTIVHPEAAPIKRLVARAREEGKVVDATQGRKTRSVIVMEGQQIVLSALLPETIFGRTAESGSQPASRQNGSINEG